MNDFATVNEGASVVIDLADNDSDIDNPANADPESLGEGTDWLGALFRNCMVPL